MKKLLGYLYIPKDIWILVILSAMMIVMDVTIYHTFFISMIVFALMPLSILAYYLLAGCVDFVSVSPVYAEFVRKKYPKWATITMLADYAVIALLSLLIQRLNLPSFSVQNGMLVVAALVAGTYSVFCPVMYRTKITGFIIYFLWIVFFSGSCGFISVVVNDNTNPGVFEELMNRINGSFLISFLLGLAVIAACCALSFVTVCLTRNFSGESHLSRNYLVRAEKAKAPKVRNSR